MGATAKSTRNSGGSRVFKKGGSSVHLLAIFGEA